jgi:hypothetical protein
VDSPPHKASRRPRAPANYGIDMPSDIDGALARLGELAYSPSTPSFGASSCDPLSSQLAGCRRKRDETPARSCKKAASKAAPDQAPVPLAELGGVSPYMLSLTCSLQRAEAAEIYSQLDMELNPLGFAGSTTFLTKAGCLGEFVVRQKAKHPRALVLMQRGSFYSLVGIDAVVGVEMLGLNPTAGRCEAGIPNAYVQNYINRLCARDLTAAVYEESDGPVVGGPKKRALVQVVSPADPVLFSRHTVGDTFLTTPGALPILAVFPSSPKSTSVVDVFSVDVESRQIRLYRGLSASKAKVVLGLPNAGVGVVGNVSPAVYKDVAPSRLQYFGFAPCACKWTTLTGTVLKRGYEIDGGELFRSAASLAASLPLHNLTACALGVAGVFPSGTPALVGHICDTAAPGVRKTLAAYVTFPSPERREANRTAIREMLCASVPLPARLASEPKRVMAVLSHSSHVNPPVLRLIADTAHTFVTLGERAPTLFRALFECARLEGVWPALPVGQDALADARKLRDELWAAFAPSRAEATRFTVGLGNGKASVFLEKSESFRGDYRRSALPAQFDAVDASVLHLRAVLEREFESPALFGLVPANLGLYFKTRPTVKPGVELIEVASASATATSTKLYTSAQLQEAVLGYKGCCEKVCEDGSALCADAASRVRSAGDGSLVPLVLCFAHVYTTLLSHCRACRSWTLGEAGEDKGAGYPGYALEVRNFWPFWLQRSEAVANSVRFSSDYKGIILTGVNAGGKSTLLRSIAACTVLHNAGLLTPCEYIGGDYGSPILKIWSADDALNRKSNFVNEANELSEMLRAAPGSRSLLLLDEILRGTSTEEGASLAGALLEHMDATPGVAFVMSTHFHEIYHQELDLPHTSFFLMGTGSDEAKTYKLAPGKCRDTRAFQTALECGLPEALVRRAVELTAKKCNEDATACRSQWKGGGAVSLSFLSPPSGAADSNPGGPGDIDIDIFALVPHLMRRVVGTPPLLLYAGEEAPPSISDAVYVLVDCVGTAYVGETSDIMRRIKEHRASKKVQDSSRIFLCSVRSKDEGLRHEKALILSAAASGIALVSYCDANRRG